MGASRKSGMNVSSINKGRSAGRRGGLGGTTTGVRVGCSALIASSLLFGVPVVLGIAVSVIRLLGVRYPSLAWATTVNSDAEELYLGHTLYQSPAHGYTGQVYTPLFPVIVSLFDHLYLWNGWALLVVIGASVSLGILAARIAYTRIGPAPTIVRVLGAGGIGAIAYWCVTSVPLSLVDEARADQLAWAFALFGLIAVADLGPAPSRWRVVSAALLLTAALWTKQTTIGVVAPACAWVVALAVVSALNRKAAVLFLATLCGINLGLLLVLNVLTHGWEFYFNFELATHEANEFTFGGNVVKGLQSGALALGFVGITWLASIAATTLRRGGSAPGRARARIGRLRAILTAEDPTGRRIMLLCLYIAFGFVLAAEIMRKQGTETNQMIGVVWALGLLAAAGWHVAQRRAGVSAATAGCLLLSFGLIQLGSFHHTATAANVEIPELELESEWPSVPLELRAWAEHHTLYTPLYADLNVPQGGPLYPNFYNFADLLASGKQPMYVVRALLNRRFDGVAFFSLEGDSYASADGKWEENYLWKLDEVIASRYVSAPGLPQGVLARRPGPEPASWMRDCFGPFTAGGASFRIHRGGGFWCSFSPGRLNMVRSPVPLSEVVTTEAVRAAGTITLSLEGRAGAEVSLVVNGGDGADWEARVNAASGKSHDIVVATYRDGAAVASQLVPATVLSGGRRQVRLRLVPAHSGGAPSIAVTRREATLSTPTTTAPFALIASNGAAFDLRAMRLAH
jgi:hypothetical protein